MRGAFVGLVSIALTGCALSHVGEEDAAIAFEPPYPATPEGTLPGDALDAGEASDGEVFWLDAETLEPVEDANVDVPAVDAGWYAKVDSGASFDLDGAASDAALDAGFYASDAALTDAGTGLYEGGPLDGGAVDAAPLACATGFELTADGGCVDVNECALSDGNSCDPVAKCTNTPGGYQCTCPNGYTDPHHDGSRCVCKVDGPHCRRPLRVILMAGQSNMLGHNSKPYRLTSYACNADATVGEGCGDTSISPDELTPLFVAQVTADYWSAGPSVAKDAISRFLCRAGVNIMFSDCTIGAFDLTDRLFRTVSDHYYSAANDAYQWGYFAPDQMTTTLGLVEMAGDHVLGAGLLQPRDDVSVLMQVGTQQDDGTQRYAVSLGPLAMGFGAGGNNQYGPELAFGHYLGNVSDDPVLLVKVVEEGSSLRVEWRSPSVELNAGNAYTSDELATESVYTQLVAVARQLQEPGGVAPYFPDYADRPVELAGFIWLQGWSDGSPVASTQYAENFRRFIADVRHDIDPSLPIVVAVTNRGDSSYPVQVAQRQVSTEYARMASCETDDLTQYYHYDSAALLVIGKRMAAALQSVW